MSTISKLFSGVEVAPENAHIKVTVVGVGQVGMACAFAIITRRLAGELCMVDVDERKLKGELMDLQHGLRYCSYMKLQAGTTYEITANSRLCIITAGSRQRQGEDRLCLLQRNVSIFKEIIPQLVKYSPNTVICVVSNPVDVMSYVAWKLSGLPHQRIFGTGTALDCSRLRYYLSERMKVDISNCHGMVVGQRGESSVVVWSGVNVAGVGLVDLNPNIGTDKDEENWNDLRRKVIDGAAEVIKLKGCNSWAIGLCVSEIAESVLRNKQSILALSTYARGHQGICQDVYVSLPCALAENGISKVVNLPLTKTESESLQSSAKEIYALLQSADIS